MYHSPHYITTTNNHSSDSPPLLLWWMIKVDNVLVNLRASSFHVHNLRNLPRATATERQYGDQAEQGLFCGKNICWPQFGDLQSSKNGGLVPPRTAWKIIFTQKCVWNLKYPSKSLFKLPKPKQICWWLLVAAELDSEMRLQRCWLADGAG